MNILVFRNRRATSWLALAVFVLLTLLAHFHHDHGLPRDAGTDVEASSSTALPSDSQSGQGLFSDCRLCNLSRPSLRPDSTSALHAPKPVVVACRPDVVSPLESHSLEEVPPLRAPPIS